MVLTIYRPDHGKHGKMAAILITIGKPKQTPTILIPNMVGIPAFTVLG